MKIAPTRVVSTSNHQGRQFEGSLNTAKLGLFMKNLISNYNNAELATLREWVSNAHDSHVVAGQKRPVEVTLPTRWSPTLTVEDFGIGMSYSDVENVYSVFLSSTKDQDNEGIGGFGIGGKAALALADQYTMIAVKDGLKNIFIFERSNSGGLKVTPAVTNEETDMPNGVKVSVAIKNTHVFSIGAINSVLQGWKQDEITLVGRESEFESFHKDTLAFDHGYVKEQLFSKDNLRGSRTLKVFVGPVAYEAPRSFWQHWEGDPYKSLLYHFGSHIAVQVPISSVTFPSSREVIEDTEANNKAVVKAARKLEKEIQKHVDSLVSNFSSIEEAYAFACSEFANRSNLSVTYGGRNLNKIKYKGIAGYTVNANDSRGDGLRLMRMSDYEMEELNSKNVNVVVRVQDEDKGLSDDTYRKYIRGAAKEAWIANSGARAAGDRRAVSILVTDEVDELHSVTSTLHDFSELRKATPVTAKGASVKLSEEERKARAAGIYVYSLHKSENSYYTRQVAFSNHPAYESGKAILVSAKGLSAELIPTIEFILGVKDRLVFVENKLSAKRIMMVFPKAVLLDDYLAAATKAERKDHRANCAKLVEFNQQFGFNSIDVARLVNLMELDSVSAEVKGYFNLELGLASVSAHRVVGYWDEPALNGLRKHLDVEDLAKRPSFANRPKAPFTLLNLGADENDLVDYLNWQIARLSK